MIMIIILNLHSGTKFSGLLRHCLHDTGTDCKLLIFRTSFICFNGVVQCIRTVSSTCSAFVRLVVRVVHSYGQQYVQCIRTVSSTCSAFVRLVVRVVHSYGQQYVQCIRTVSSTCSAFVRLVVRVVHSYGQQYVQCIRTVSSTCSAFVRLVVHSYGQQCIRTVSSTCSAFVRLVVHVVHSYGQQQMQCIRLALLKLVFTLKTECRRSNVSFTGLKFVR